MVRGGASTAPPWRFRRQRTRNLGLDRAGDGYASDGLADTVYVIASGYGVLRWGDVVLECTAGDVLFVPAGRAHRFEQVDGAMRVWRISAAGPAGGGEKP